MFDDFDDLLNDEDFECQQSESKQQCSRRRETNRKPQVTRKVITRESFEDTSVDDLLDELDLGSPKTSFATSKSKKTFGTPSARSTNTKSSGFSTRLGASLDDSESDDDGGMISSHKPTVLGGEAAKTARLGSVTRRVASEKIRCLHCDFAVQRWPGYQWSDEADYMFFRNTAPDRDRMSIMLEKRNGFAAYACQCSWVAVDGIKSIRFGDVVQGKGLKWASS